MNVPSPAITALAASAINLGVDLTFVAHFVLFATFVAVMRPLLFEPLLRVFRERERRTAGAKERARELDEEAHRMIARVDAEVAKTRAQAGVERDQQRAEIARLEANIMADARQEAAEILSAGKHRIAAEIEYLRAQLAAGTPDVAARIASKILGREVGS